MNKPNTGLDEELTKALSDSGLRGTVNRAFWASGIGPGELRSFGYVWNNSVTDEKVVLARSGASDYWTDALDRDLRIEAEGAIKKAAELPT